MQDAIVDKWERLFKGYFWEGLMELSNAYPDRQSLLVKFKDIDIHDPELADQLLEDPDVTLESGIYALRDTSLPNGVVLDHAHLRILDIPVKKRIREIRSSDIGELVSFEAVVTKVTEVHPRVVEAVFQCPFCGHQFGIIQGKWSFEEPTKCEQCDKKVSKFLFLQDKSEFVDTQRVRLQEPPEGLRGGEIPQTLDTQFEEDIAGYAIPGARVTIVGILRSHQRFSAYGRSPDFSIYLDCNSLTLMEEVFEEIELTKEDEETIFALKDDPRLYEKLIISIAPSIYGYEEIKEAMLLQSFAGYPKESEDGQRTRGDIHVLLVGDPAVSKSMLLENAVRTAPRGIYTSGKTSTSAGLTAAMTKDKEFGGAEKWTVEAGAMVLADKGLIAVDELDKMRDEDKAGLHESLEQQTVTITKAGICMRLPARCSLLGAANPKYGRFDKYTPLADQINFTPALLSRFDLIFTMLDQPNEDQDEKTAEFIMKTMRGRQVLSNVKRGYKMSDSEKKLLKSLKPEIELELMRKYIAWSRKNIFPILTDEAERTFLDFYIGIRRLGYEDEDAPVPITVRQLESLIRLGEAKARSRLSDKITAEDADRVINVVTYCLKRVFVDPETDKLDVDWVTVGTTKTRRDRARSIREIIKELEKGYGEEVPIEEVLDLAEEQGMEREKAEDVIEVMKRDGILLSPESGVITLKHGGE